MMMGHVKVITSVKDYTVKRMPKKTQSRDIHQ